MNTQTSMVISDPPLDFAAVLRSGAFYEEPYPVYRQLRDQAPVFHDAASDLWFVSRHEDIARALLSPGLFSSTGGNALRDDPSRVGRTLGTMDPPRHDELRAIMVRGFTPARINQVIPRMRQSVQDRLSDFGSRRECDLVGDVTRPVLLETLGLILGLDEDAAKRAALLQAALFHHIDGPLGAALSPGDFGAVMALLAEQLERRRREPDTDLFSVLLAAQAAGLPISDGEIVANMSTVLLAGAASIGHFAPNLFHALWAHPDARSRVLTSPELIDRAIEEAVRWDTSTQAFARTAVEDLDVAGVRIPKGARMALIYASANRDERVIERPDEFDLDRRKVRHFGFGGGAHHCLGAPTARLFCRAILIEALPRLGEFDIDLGEAERVHHMMVRGFSKLPIRW